LKTPDAIKRIRDTIGDIEIVICSITIAELGHGIYPAAPSERTHQRRKFLDELKAHVPAHPVTATTAEIIAQIGGQQAAKGINIPFADLIIGACALELGYAVGTANSRDISRIPGLA
jgi:predicted nucleic acid-binding protein